MDKIELKDLTFLIALKIDSQDRLSNLDLTMDYLQSNFDTNIVLCEQDSQPTLKERYNCQYVFYKTDEFFNRQRGVNLAARAAKTSVIVHYDADILLAPKQIVRAFEVILNDQADVVYPYDGHFYDVPKDQHCAIKQSKSVDVIDVSRCTLFNPHSVGGAVFFRNSVFWAGGAANENFKGLGYEDNEINTRFSRLGYRIGRITKPLFHLTHERKETSFNYNPYLNSNRDEHTRIASMSKEQLEQEIKTWKWCHDNI